MKLPMRLKRTKGVHEFMPHMVERYPSHPTVVSILKRYHRGLSIPAAD